MANEKVVEVEIAEEKVLTYFNMDGDYIIEWCEKNNQKEWLKKIAASTNEKGNPISYLEVKRAFCKTFMPELCPPDKVKKVGFFERVKSL